MKKNLGKFCRESKCPAYIEWSYNPADPSDNYGIVYCESCKLVGQSYSIEEYPDDCIHLDAIKRYKENTNEK